MNGLPFLYYFYFNMNFKKKMEKIRGQKFDRTKVRLFRRFELMSARTNVLDSLRHLNQQQSYHQLTSHLCLVFIGTIFQILIWLCGLRKSVITVNRSVRTLSKSVTTVNPTQRCHLVIYNCDFAMRFDEEIRYFLLFQKWSFCHP